MFLNYHFWKIRKQAGPTKKFRSALWRQLSSHYDDLNPQPAKLIWRLRIIEYAVIFLVIILIVGSVSTGAYAYENPDVNEASVLYPIKKAVEKIEGSLAKTPAAKADFQLKQIRRREAELEKLSAQQKSFEKTLIVLKQAEEAGLAMADNVTSTEARGIIIQKIVENKTAHLQKLEVISKKLPEKASERLKQVIENQSQNLKEKINKLQEKQDKIIEKQKINILPSGRLNGQGRTEESKNKNNKQASL